MIDEAEIKRRYERALFEAYIQLGNGTWNLNKLIRILEGKAD